MGISWPWSRYECRESSGIRVPAKLVIPGAWTVLQGQLILQSEPREFFC
jgi:hypothetical protein